MVAFIYYPIYLVVFWYKDVIFGVFEFFVAFNRYVASLLSLPLLIGTFFKPLKNEYRDGLVLFSIISGIIVKTFLISVSLLIVFFILFVEILVCFLLALFPIILIVIFISPQSIIK